MNLFVHDVHGDFEAKTHFGRCWFSPHSDLLMVKFEPTPCLVRKVIIGASAPVVAVSNHEHALKNFMKQASICVHPPRYPRRAPLPWSM